MGNVHHLCRASQSSLNLKPVLKQYNSLLRRRLALPVSPGAFMVHDASPSVPPSPVMFVVPPSPVVLWFTGLSGVYSGRHSQVITHSQNEAGVEQKPRDEYLQKLSSLPSGDASVPLACWRAMLVAH